jgi:hypothetical protein
MLGLIIGPLALAVGVAAVVIRRRQPPTTPDEDAADLLSPLFARRLARAARLATEAAAKQDQR